MIDAKAEGNWRAKFKALTDELKQAGATSGIVRPTKVLYELSRMKGSAVLGTATTGMQRKIKAEMVPVMAKAIEGKPEGWEQRAARVYRRWMYKYIEELYVEVRSKSQWGQVEAETKRRKEKDAAQQKEQRRVALEERRAARKASGQSPAKRKPRKKRATRRPRAARTTNAANANTYGIRHTRPDWRSVQKGKADSGKRRPEQTEGSEPVLTVTINGRVIARD